MTRRTKQNSPSEGAYEPFDDDNDGDEDANPGDPHAARLDARTRHAPLAEDEGLGDSDDDNLSGLFASLGVEERLDELGM